jgi:hypothetical protein
VKLSLCDSTARAARGVARVCNVADRAPDCIAPAVCRTWLANSKGPCAGSAPPFAFPGLHPEGSVFSS